MSFNHDGLAPSTEWVVDSLAKEGFGAIAPDHYHVLPPGVGIARRREFLTDEQYVADFRAAAAWLTAQPGIDAARLAIVGHCAGGRAAWVGLEGCADLWRCGCVWYGGGAKRQMGQLPSPYERLELIRCPVAGFFGERDENPSPADVQDFDVALTRFGVPHQFHMYQGAGHGFMNEENPAYHPEAAKASWATAIDFLRSQLI